MTERDAALDVLPSDAAIDILFTDIRLPGAMGGWQIADAARSLRPGLPIISGTGFTQTPPRHADGSIFFTKPYGSNAIICRNPHPG